MFKHFLVPLSHDSHNHALVEAACALAQPLKAFITFYHAQPSYSPVMMMEEPLVWENALQQYYKVLEEDSQRILQAAQAFAVGAGLECDSHCQQQDSPYEGIVAYTKERGCDLIFMASSGKKGLAAVLLGSQTQKVLAYSPVPVLVYRVPLLAEEAL